MNRKGSIVTNLILAGIVMILISIFLFKVVLPMFFPPRVPPAVQNQYISLAELLNNMEGGDEDFFYYNMRNEYFLTLFKVSDLKADFFKTNGVLGPIFKVEAKNSKALASKVATSCNENLCLCMFHYPDKKQISLIECTDIKGFQDFFDNIDSFTLIEEDLTKLIIKKLGSQGRLHIVED